MKGDKVYFDKKYTIVIVVLLLLCVLLFYFSFPNYYQYGYDSSTTTIVEQTQVYQQNQHLSNSTASLTNVGIGLLDTTVTSFLYLFALGVFAYYCFVFWRGFKDTFKGCK